MQQLRLLSLFATGVLALTPSQWRSQAIYQVLTDRFALNSGSTTATCNLQNYCGGSWQGLISKLDYIQDMGFTAVWISPVVSNLDELTAYGEAYHGYWASDFTSLNHHFGSADDLNALSSALHSRGMYLMVDIVVNHMGWNGGPDQVQYNKFRPFNKKSFFHNYCSINYTNQTSVEDCWLGDQIVSLPDLRTEEVTVARLWGEWVTNFVSKYNIDGLRIDSAMEVNKDFYPSFVSSSGVYAVGEVYHGSPAVICPYQDVMPGILNYASYFWIKNLFSSTTTSLKELVDGLSWLKGSCKDTTLMANFMENHDVPRFASITKDEGLTKSALTYIFMNDGIPIVYQGQEQGFSGSNTPNNREALWLSGYNTNAPLYQYISKLNWIRNHIIGKDVEYVSRKSTVVYSDDHCFALRKGSSDKTVISIFGNHGSGNSFYITLRSSSTGWSSSQQLKDLLTCKTYTTDYNGDLSITLENGLPSILYPSNAAKDADICL
ncbi:glycoside hydrolase family 13 protein [Piedraia hortae CBS 480.64]|uniref:alpha-amylase n=1 Tax=Piedraia hortae CBS 480.64 TaxID=1314780 RepID=A0A6A7BUT1_9PEZI|nr:glycoside hydrolase family 13 protein [Piedraia hortae CBS 480.64]